MFEVLLFWKSVNLLQVVYLLFDLSNVGFLLLPKHIGVSCFVYHDMNKKAFVSYKYELELSWFAQSHSSHSYKLQFIEIKSKLLINELVSFFIDAIAMNVLLSESNFFFCLFPFGTQIDKDWCTSDDVVVIDGSVLFFVDF